MKGSLLAAITLIKSSYIWSLFLSMKPSTYLEVRRWWGIEGGEERQWVEGKRRGQRGRDKEEG
jgi:hypothetical protein